MTAPDRIWAQKPDIFDNCALWQDIPSDRHEDTEYIRADLVATMIRDAVEAEREACAKMADDMARSDANMARVWRAGCADTAAAIRARKGGA